MHGPGVSEVQADPAIVVRSTMKQLLGNVENIQ
jgi:hypothetical protein